MSDTTPAVDAPLAIVPNPVAAPRLLTLSQAASMLAPVGTEPPSERTLRRWINHGCRGVRLRAVRLGAQYVTTPEAVEQFERDLFNADTTPPEPAPKRGRPAKAQASIGAAARALSAVGVNVK